MLIILISYSSFSPPFHRLLLKNDMLNETHVKYNEINNYPLKSSLFRLEMLSSNPLVMSNTAMEKRSFHCFYSLV